MTQQQSVLPGVARFLCLKNHKLMTENQKKIVAFGNNYVILHQN